MSVEALTWAFRADVRPAGAKLVLLRLANHADRNGECWPGQELLALYSAQTRATVGRNLAKLEEEGWIRRVRRYRDSGEYRYRTSDGYVLNIDAPGLPYVTEPYVKKPNISVETAETYVPKTANLCDENGELTYQNDPNLRNETFQESIRETSGEPIREKTVKARGRAPVSAAEADALFEAFWKVYPRNNTKRKTARDAFDKALQRADFGVILEGARRYAADPNLPAVQYRPHASTWLNGDRWEDGPEPAPAPTLDRQGEILRTEMEWARAADAGLVEADPWALPAGGDVVPGVLALEGGRND